MIPSVVINMKEREGGAQDQRQIKRLVHKRKPAAVGWDGKESVRGGDALHDQP